jgi:hypothetical protein
MRRLLVSPALLALLVATVASADTVDIAGEDRPTTGRLLSASAGDVACYLEFADAKGARFTALADFAFCKSDALHGQWVRIGYTAGRVMADSCEGNPDCAATQVVALVTTLARTGPPPQGTLCAAGETVLYSCATGSKLVSVCTPAGTAAPSLSYRFGKLGSQPEMILGGATGADNPAIYGRTEAFAGGGGAWIRFRNGEVAYVVYAGVGRWGANGESATKEGVVVERRGATIAHLRCDTTPINQLSPELFESLGLDPASDEAFLFPD